MQAPQSLPTGRKITLDEFIAFTGWDPEAGRSPWIRARMKVALDLYQDTVPHRIRRILLGPGNIASPWSLPRGRPIKLADLMQAIDFTHPVDRMTIAPNTLLKSFRPTAETGDRPQGNWFTLPQGSQRELAIPPSQSFARMFRVTNAAECLRSTVSDAFTWIEASQARARHEDFSDKYFRGSGCQYFIWKPELYLMPAMPAPQSLPTDRPMTLDEFIAYTDCWNPATVGKPWIRGRMQRALDFYQYHITDRTKLLGPGSNANNRFFSPRGRSLKLRDYMTPIDFGYPVTRVRLAPNTNTLLKSFRPPAETGDLPKGNWFTLPLASQHSVAISPSQTSERMWRVMHEVECLRSMVSDAFTWIEMPQATRYDDFSGEYFRGYGLQYFIWEPGLYLVKA